ncbi:HAD family hydrolase [Fervidobacterium sp.]
MSTTLEKLTTQITSSDQLYKNKEKYYLNFDVLPSDVEKELIFLGIPKLLFVRNEIIHVKHLLKEVFVKKNKSYLKHVLKYSDLVAYANFMTNRIRKILKFPRIINVRPSEINKDAYKNFYRMLSQHLKEEFKLSICIDFDHTITKFPEFYRFVHEQIKKYPKNHRLYIISANNKESITGFIEKHKLPRPNDILGQKKDGKVEALKKIIKNSHFTIFVDNEREYCEIAHVFGAYAYLIVGKTEDNFPKLKYITLKKD